MTEEVFSSVKALVEKQEISAAQTSAGHHRVIQFFPSGGAESGAFRSGADLPPELNYSNR
jgi:hypothetical protein